MRYGGTHAYFPIRKALLILEEAIRPEAFLKNDTQGNIYARNKSFG